VIDVLFGVVRLESMNCLLLALTWKSFRRAFEDVGIVGWLDDE
jgi:hypothetical protein